ncbi:MAG: cysteine hydrolase [Microbacterium enclense]
MNPLRRNQDDFLRSRAGRPALIVVDVQRDFADPERLSEYGLTDDVFVALAAAVERIGDLVAAARQAGVPVFWVELGSDPDHPWRSSRWLRSGDVSPVEGEPCVVGTDGAEWFGVAPALGEQRVVKTGYSGFFGTDLAERLRADGVGWVSVCGVTTECCVAATAQDAMQADWPVVVPADATAAYETPLHEAALTALALNVALVTSVDEVVSLWAGGDA